MQQPTRVKMSEAVGSFSREAMVRGYHIYNSIWEAYVGEELSCQRDEGNGRWRLESLKMALCVKDGHLEMED